MRSDERPEAARTQAAIRSSGRVTLRVAAGTSFAFDALLVGVTAEVAAVDFGPVDRSGHGAVTDAMSAFERRLVHCYDPVELEQGFFAGLFAISMLTISAAGSLMF